MAFVVVLMSREYGRIFTRTLGCGPAVVMVHGWGMHGGVWRDFAMRLAEAFQVTLVDLPGHGRSGMVADYSLDGLSSALLEIAPEKAHWLGWSLGAALGLHLAHQYPERVSSLVMMAGNARFSRADDWPHGMEPAVLAKFAGDMMENCHHTLLRFLGLQVWGLDHARELMKQLHGCVEECEPPQLDALRAGLKILQEADLRDRLAMLQKPLLLMMGTRDRLVPQPAGPAMAQLCAGSRLHELDLAGHVPFLTHPAECVGVLQEFWRFHGQNG